MRRKLVMQVAFVFLSAGAVFTGTPPALAQDSAGAASEAARMDSLAAGKGGAPVQGKLEQEFQAFLGQDSKAVVTGLRTGQTIALAETIPVPDQPPTIRTVRINPPTGKMGYGNVFISLSLAKQQLNQAGIARPTPSQLQAALLGGSVTNAQGATTNLQGVLTLRGQGMGWGQIAQVYGTKLGAVVGGMKAANHGIAVRSGGGVGTGISGRDAADAGSQPGGADGPGKGNGYGRSGGAGAIVTGAGEVGAGGRVSGEANAGSGRQVETQGDFSTRGHGYGRGIVSGSGAEVAPSGGVGAGGRGGLGLGRGRGK